MKNDTMTGHPNIFGPAKTIDCSENKYFTAMTAGDQRYVRVHFLRNI